MRASNTSASLNTAGGYSQHPEMLNSRNNAGWFEAVKRAAHKKQYFFVFQHEQRNTIPALIEYANVDPGSFQDPFDVILSTASKEVREWILQNTAHLISNQARRNYIQQKYNNIVLAPPAYGQNLHASNPYFITHSGDSGVNFDSKFKTCLVEVYDKYPNFLAMDAVPLQSGYISDNPAVGTTLEQLEKLLPLEQWDEVCSCKPKYYSVYTQIVSNYNIQKNGRESVQDRLDSFKSYIFPNDKDETRQLVIVKTQV